MHAFCAFSNLLNLMVDSQILFFWSIFENQLVFGRQISANKAFDLNVKVNKSLNFDVWVNTWFYNLTFDLITNSKFCQLSLDSIRLETESNPSKFSSTELCEEWYLLVVLASCKRSQSEVKKWVNRGTLKFSLEIWITFVSAKKCS